MPFSSIAANRRPALKDLAAIRVVGTATVLADFSKWNFATRPSYISFVPFAARLATKNTEGFVCFALGSGNPPGERNELLLSRSVLFLSFLSSLSKSPYTYIHIYTRIQLCANLSLGGRETRLVKTELYKLFEHRAALFSGSVLTISARLLLKSHRAREICGCLI